jgi:hypothetical protein
MQVQQLAIQSSKERTLPSRTSWWKGLIESSNIQRELTVGYTTMHTHIASEGKWNFWVCVTNQRHLANGETTDINWTPSMSMDTVASGHAQSTNKTANKNIGTNVELTWLRIAVRKFNSGANVAGIWTESNYKSYRILYHLSNGYLHALIQSTV